VLETPEKSWWRPLSTDTYSYGRSISRPIEFTQDDKSNRPDPMTINVWNLRFLQGESFEQSDPVVGTKLSWTSEAPRGRAGAERIPHVTGTIRNQSGQTWSHVWLRSAMGIYELTPKGGLTNGADVPVDVFMDRNDEWTRERGPVQYSRYGHKIEDLAGAPLSLIRAAGQLDWHRDHAIEELISRDSGWYNAEEPSAQAVIYALCETAPAAETLVDRKPIEKHWQVVRALVTVQRAAGKPQ
jgi:hypothetical protein